MDLVEPHQNRNQIREKNFPFIIELTVPLPECSGGHSGPSSAAYLITKNGPDKVLKAIDQPRACNYYFQPCE